MENKLLRADRPDCLWARKSIRKFLPQMPPQADIEDAIRKAQRAPSFKNSQPWEVLALRDAEKKNQLSRLLIGLLEDGTPPSPDLTSPQSFPPSLQTRISATMQARNQALGITSNSPISSNASQKKNFQFFGAPLVLFFYQHKELSPWSILDAGMFIQNVMLALCEKEIGSVPQAYLTDYAQETKKFLNIPDDRRLLLGMSVGYANMSHALFSLYTEREDLSNMFHWL